jgi:Cu(I)/Ag(I) efflux system membrane fusion protein
VRRPIRLEGERFMVRVPFVATLMVSLLVLGTTARPAAASQEALAGVVAPYLKVQETLAAEKTAGVRDHATAIVAAASKLGKPGEPLVAAARQLQTAGSLPLARDAFFALTTALFKYADATKTSLGPGVRRAYCPMEKKSWAQKDGQISNPYAGATMPRCGEFTDRKSS